MEHPLVDKWREKFLDAWNIKKNFKSLYSIEGNLAVLDGLRAWAVLWVIAYHYLGFYPFVNPYVDKQSMDHYNNFEDSWIVRVLVWGDLGVDIFFVLSGFLIYQMLAKEYHRSQKINYKKFLFRRWLRLMPTYFASFGIMMSIVPLRNFGGVNQLDSCLKWGWSNLLFLNNFIGPSGYGACLGHTWTIAMEFQFYLISPMIVVTMLSQKEWGTKVAWLLMFLTTVIRAIIFFENIDLVGNENILYQTTYTRCQPYLAGMIACHFYLQLKNRKKDSDTPQPLSEDGLPLVSTPDTQTDDFSNVIAAQIQRKSVRYTLHTIFGALWLLISIGGTIGFSKYVVVDTLQVVFGRVVFGICVGYWIFMCLNGYAKAFAWVLSLRVWAPIARLSYGAYLLQFVGLVSGMLIPFTANDSLAAIFFLYLSMLAVGVTIVLVMCFLVYMLVEKPFMNLR